MGVRVDCVCKNSESKAVMVRENIRGVVVVLLQAAFSGGAVVFDGSEHPLTPASMPGLCFWMPEDRNGGGTLQATTKLADARFAVYVEGDHPTAGGEVVAEIAPALYGSLSEGRYLGGLVTNIVFSGLSSRYDSAAFVRHTRYEVSYSFEYQTIDGDDETAT